MGQVETPPPPAPPPVWLTITRSEALFDGAEPAPDTNASPRRNHVVLSVGAAESVYLTQLALLSLSCTVMVSWALSERRKLAASVPRSVTLDSAIWVAVVGVAALKRSLPEPGLAIVVEVS